MALTAEKFISKWKDAEGGQERANYAMFLTELCQMLDVPSPDVAGATTENNDYVFERAVTFTDRDGRTSQGRIDLYKRGSFVLEAKQSRQKGGKKELAGQDDLFGTSKATNKRATPRDWDVLMLNARQQAENYAKHLPTAHEWPPFIIVCDVGNCFELYADFTGKGRHYNQFPDRQGFRIHLADLLVEDTRKLLKGIWTDPYALDPSKKAAKATREIASALAEVSKRLEKENHPPEEVALFLMRCLFTMFAEDNDLIPKESFTNLLGRCTTNPASFMPNLKELWTAMNSGSEFSVSIQSSVKKFNGNLFRDARVFPMAKEDIGVLKVAAGKDWREVDPSIFGTLLEQALSPTDRSKLGAHYTPRAYVERLVNATVIDPMREEWNTIQGSLEVDASEALSRVKEFHQKMCETRVLDPACGTGNFLYVTLELMKRLEGEVLDMIERLGGQDALRLERFTVDPHQFLGIELNPRAAAIAELVLWIGYLRWHLKTKGETPPEPILREFKNIERRDAVLLHDGVDAKGNYINPRRPEWPEAEYIVGNPPFIGGKDIRSQTSDAYVEALWKAHKEMNDSADFVMYWWDRAAELLTRKEAVLRRFGLITTNSITQTFQRRTIERYQKAKAPISLIMAIPDHPWTKASDDAAAVRIAMTVAEPGSKLGQLFEVVTEKALGTDVPEISMTNKTGLINSDLTIGIDVTQAIVLKSNEGLCSPGVKLHGSGFIVTRPQAEHLGLGRRKGLERHIREYRNGRDLTGNSRDVLVIDLFDLEAEDVRQRFPEVYQHILQTVKPERDQNNRDSYKRLWWVFGEPRKDLRPALAGLKRYIVTIETAKHRIFFFLQDSVLPDNKLIVVADESYATFGVLSGRVHQVWADRVAGQLGPTPVWVKTASFDPFPFCNFEPSSRRKVESIAKLLDEHRTNVVEKNPHITYTEMYNVLEKIKANAPLNADDTRIRDDGLILILKELHEELDAAVADAYGWPHDLTDEQILERLVVLNKERAEEEKRGLVRWLRPDYQIPRFGSAVDKARQLEADLQVPETVVAKTKISFPTGAVDQTAAIMSVLALTNASLTSTEIAQTFKQGKKAQPRVEETLRSLLRTGFIASTDGGRKFTLRRVA